MHLIGLALLCLALGDDPANPNVVPHFRPPVVTLGDNGGYTYGDLAIVTANVDDAKLPDNLASMQFVWLVFDENGKEKSVFTADGGREIAFAIGLKPTTITVICNVNCLFEEKKELSVLDGTGKPALRDVVTAAASVSPKPLVKVIAVGGTPPRPAPQPQPPPAPVGPTFPPGAYDLAQFTYDTFQADNSMTPDEKAKVAKALATGFGGIAAKIAATPSYSDIPTIIADLKVYNDRNLSGTGVPSSKTAVVQSIIKARVNGLYRDRKITSVGQFAMAFQEIARGLSAVEK